MISKYILLATSCLILSTSGIQARQLTNKDRFILSNVESINIQAKFIADDEVRNLILSYTENLRLLAVSGRIPQGIIQTHNGLQLY